MSKGKRKGPRRWSPEWWAATFAWFDEMDLAHWGTCPKHPNGSDPCEYCAVGCAPDTRLMAMRAERQAS